jgi:CHASE3 domain sensor protein
MRSGAWRFLVLIVLLASGGGAAWSSWHASRQIAQLDRSQREASHRVDRLLANLDSVTAAQQTYVTTSPATLEPSRVPELIGEIRSEIERLRPHMRSTEGGRSLQSVAAAAASLQDIETRAQDHVRLGQSLMAADLVSAEGHAADEVMASGLRTIRTAEDDAYATARAEALDLSWTVAASVAAVWALGLILMVVRKPPLPEQIPVPAPTQPLLGIPDAADARLPATHPDLQSAAEVCTAIGRLTSAEALPELLRRAASVLDASGIVVWMAAGEELFAAAAFGYPPQVIRKLGPINRAAINATAAAWRDGTLQAVSGDHGARGALAAPMLGPDRCIGVLAVEVGIGGDGHAATRAVTMMFAAQLAAALAGWPAASSASAAAPDNVPPFDRAAEG